MANDDKVEKWLEQYLQSNVEEKKKMLEESQSKGVEAMKAAEFAERMRYLFKHKESIAFAAKIKGIAEGLPEATPMEIATFESAVSPAHHLLEWAIAAIVVAGLLFWAVPKAIKFLKEPSTQEIKAYRRIAQPYLVPFENNLNLRENPVDPLWQGMQAYDAGDFHTAATFLDKANQNSSSTSIQFYLGISQLLSEQTDKAIKTFSDNALLSDEDLSASVKWYLSIAYLQKGQKDKTLKLLSELTETGGYGDVAKILSKTIEAAE